MPDSQLSIVASVVAAVATPATLALSAYQITGDPGLRPLAVAIETVSVRESVDRSAIRVTILWPGDPRSADVAAFAAGIRDSVVALGPTPHITARAVARGRPGTVTFRTGPNVYGPYPLSGAARGVRSAVAAWRMASADGEAGT